MVQFQGLDEETQNRYLLRLQLALRSMDEAAISTIHSFCAKALQDHALAGNQYFDNEYWLTRTSSGKLPNTTGGAGKLIISKQLNYSYLILLFKTSTHFSNWLDDIRRKPNSKRLPSPTTSLQSIFQRFKSLEQALLELPREWHDGIADILRDSPVLSRSGKLPYHKDSIENFLSQIGHYFFAQQALPLPQDFHYLASDVLHANSKPSKRGQDANLDHSFFTSLMSSTSAVMNSLQN